MGRWTPEHLKTVQNRLPRRPLAAPERPPVDSTKAQATSVSPEAVQRPKRSKYGAVKVGGYASKREAKRAAQLKLLERAGAIRDLREQVEFVLIPKQGKERAVKYRCDFDYQELRSDESGSGWRRVIEDTKGHRTPDYIIKRKLMLFIHGITIRET